MQPKALFRIALAVAVSISVSSPAEAQLGRVGGAIKKKAKEAVGDKAAEVVGGKEEAKPAAAGTNAAPAPAPANKVAAQAPAPSLVIDNAVLTRFAKSLDVETARRTGVKKRAACINKAGQGPEMMQVLMEMGPEADKIQNSKTLSDAQKVAEVQRMIVAMEEKQKAVEVKLCGPVMEEMYIPQHEKIAGEANGFTQQEYAKLKERIAPYCLARERGSDTPADTRLAYTEDEMVAMRPRCAALMTVFKQIS